MKRYKLSYLCKVSQLMSFNLCSPKFTNLFSLTRTSKSELKSVFQAVSLFY